MQYACNQIIGPAVGFVVPSSRVRIVGGWPGSGRAHGPASVPRPPHPPSAPRQPGPTPPQRPCGRPLLEGEVHASAGRRPVAQGAQHTGVLPHRVEKGGRAPPACSIWTRGSIFSTESRRWDSVRAVCQSEWTGGGEGRGGGSNWYSQKIFFRLRQRQQRRQCDHGGRPTAFPKLKSRPKARHRLTEAPPRP